MADKAIYTVSITDGDREPWISSFSSRERAEAFKCKAKERLKQYGATWVSVESDKGSLDSEEYLEWIDDTYGSGD